MELNWKKILISAVIILCIAITSGCSNYTEVRLEPKPDCTSNPEVRKQLAEFVLTCAKNANPLSDEEGEDLVAQCQKTGTQVVCPVTMSHVTYNCDGMGACWQAFYVPIKKGS